MKALKALPFLVAITTALALAGCSAFVVAPPKVSNIFRKFCVCAVSHPLLSARNISHIHMRMFFWKYSQRINEGGQSSLKVARSRLHLSTFTLGSFG